MTTPTPTLNADGTVDAVVVGKEAIADASLLRLQLPITISYAPISGRYFLARCGAQTVEERMQNWQFPLRKTLFPTTFRPTTQADGMPVGEWQVLLPSPIDAGSIWLHELELGSLLNLLGPFGNGFTLDPLAQRYLILADSPRAATLLSFVEGALDAGKKVALVTKDDALRDALLERLAIAVEVHHTSSPTEWDQRVTELLGWADQLCLVQSQPTLTQLAPQLAGQIRQQRSRFDSGFAQILVEADLVCGVGACLACVVPLANGGLTRACVHGPVMDLRQLLAG